MNDTNLDNKIERAVLVGLCANNLPDEKNATKSTLDELEALLETAGGECVGMILQNRPAPDPKTFIGEGKALEIRDFAEVNNADLVIFDNQISPSQMRNLEEIIGVSVLDRSTLILDIFAGRAKTNEGKLQVELAQYEYILPRLQGLGKSMSRLGGGIGTRGPGESKLESDRRHIRARIDRLRRELAEVKKVRAVQRKQREKSQIPLISIVGYTNAGKSTLLNTLTGAGISANDRLFDTLDTTTRKFRISDTQEIFLSDTVGFIQKLPHHLVEAFKATLEELTSADILLHVTDASDPECSTHIKTVNSVIEELGASHIPQILVLNKADKCDEQGLYMFGENIAISAKYKKNLDGLLTAIERALNRGKHKIKICIPFSDGHMLEQIHRDTSVLSTDYSETGTELLVICDEKVYGRLKEYIISSEE